MRAPVITPEMIGDGFGWETWPGELDVRDYGADPTGILDSTAALQTAIDTACHTSHPRSVLLPPGDYIFSSSLRFYDGISFGGIPDIGARWNWGSAAHRGVRLIWVGGAATPAIFLGGTAETSQLIWQLEGVYLHDFVLIPDLVAVTGGGIVTDGQDGIVINGSQAGTYPDALRVATFDILFERVSVRYFGRNNYRLEGNVFDVRMDDCTTHFPGADGIETVNVVSEGSNHPGNIRLNNIQTYSSIEDTWAIDFLAATNSSIHGGLVYGKANGVRLGSYDFLDKTKFEGEEDALNKIGICIMGQGVNVCSNIVGYTTGLQIGEGGAEVVTGWSYSGNYIKCTTTGLLVTAGGDRRGIFHEPHFTTTPTPINNARFDTDGMQDVNFISNEVIMTIFTSDHTPDVFLKDKIAMTGIATVTDLENPTEGQLVDILILSDTVDFTHSANLRLQGSVNWTTGIAGDSISFIRRGTSWYEVNRHIKTTEAYTETNVTPDRAFNADTVAIAELADVVGTLIVDLRAKGMVR